jgi:hypothetical protein
MKAYARETFFKYFDEKRKLCIKGFERFFSKLKNYDVLIF